MTGIFRRLLLICLMVLAPCARSVAQPTMGADEYRAQLEASQTLLQNEEKRAPHRLDTALRPLAKPLRVRRADGEIQSAGGDEWQRRMDDAANAAQSKSPAKVGAPTAAFGVAKGPVFATKSTLRNARAALQRRLDALREWTQPPPRGFSSPDAQQIVGALASSGQIRTGPTGLQLFWSNIGQAIGNAWEAFTRWLDGLFPRPTATPTRTPSFNGRWIEIAFYGLVGALLLMLGFLAWRAFSGRWRGEGARREVRLADEDAELLRLPPDELAERAARFAAEGNFPEALRYLYLSLLLQLDARDVWRYDARRTNWEHIAALRAQMAPRGGLTPASPAHGALDLLSDLTRRFDRVRYGNAPCESADWTRFEADVARVRGDASHLPNTVAPRSTKPKIDASRAKAAR